MNERRSISTEEALKELDRQIKLPSSKEHQFDFDIAEINVALSAEGKMLKIESGPQDMPLRWTLYMGSHPITGSSEITFSYLMTDMNERETLLYLRAFRSGLEEERKIAEASLQTLVDKFTDILKKGTKLP